jgi:RNA polymerase sigma factor (sigma-70 family)
LLARFLRERRAGDARAAEATWRELTVRNLDRIRVAVATFRFPGGQVIAATEHGSATTEAFMRVVDLGRNFRGHSMGELRNAVARAVWNACMDWGRRELAHDRRIGGSLDEPAFDEDGGGRSRFEGEIAGASREREAVAADSEEAEALRASYVAMVREAIPQVRNDNYRKVLHMTFVERSEAEEIAARLDISLPNVYQRRRRGNLELEKILRDQRT